MALAKLVDLFHGLQSVCFVVLTFVAPVQWLPLMVCSIIYMLTRYHDYCVFSELAEILRQWEGGTGPSYSQRTSNFWGWDRSVNSVVAALVVGLAALFAMLRITLALPRARGSPYAAYGWTLLVAAFLAEIAIHFYKTREKEGGEKSAGALLSGRHAYRHDHRDHVAARGVRWTVDLPQAE